MWRTLIGSRVYVRVPKDKRITVPQWILIWSALAGALAETRLVTDPEATVINRKKVVVRLAQVFATVCDLFNHGLSHRKGAWKLSDAHVRQHAEGLEKLVSHLGPARNKCSKGASNPSNPYRLWQYQTATDNLDCVTLIFLVHGLGVRNTIPLVFRQIENIDGSPGTAVIVVLSVWWWQSYLISPLLMLTAVLF